MLEDLTLMVLPKILCYQSHFDLKICSIITIYRISGDPLPRTVFGGKRENSGLKGSEREKYLRIQRNLCRVDTQKSIVLCNGPFRVRQNKQWSIQLVVPRHSLNQIPPPLCSVPYPPFHCSGLLGWHIEPNLRGAPINAESCELLTMQQELLHLQPTAATADVWEWVGTPFQVWAAYWKLLRANMEKRLTLSRHVNAYGRSRSL